MACKWELQKVLVTKCGIATATALQKLVASKAGVKLSLESVSKLIRKPPDAIRFKTMQALCNATGLELHDFLEITPEHSEYENAARPLYPSHKAVQKPVSGFPPPRNFYVARKKG